MLKLIGLITLIWLAFHFGLVQLLAVWGMVALSAIASI